MRFCLRQSVAITCTIEKSTVSNIWIYFNVLKGYKKEEYKRKRGHAPYGWIVQRHRTTQKKGGAQEHLHVFHKDTKPSVFLVFFIMLIFRFFSLFSLFQTILPSLAWRGIGGFYKRVLACGRFWQREMHMAFEGYSANGLLFFAMYRERLPGMKQDTQTKRTKTNTKKVEINPLDSRFFHSQC
jgi:hypothetical protein